MYIHIYVYILKTFLDTWFSNVISDSRMFELIRGDYKPFIALEESAQERELLAFEPPAKGTAWQKMLQVGINDAWEETKNG